MTAIGYIRVSGYGQTNRLGPQMQEATIRQWAEAHGHAIGELYRDTISGTLLERPGLGGALQALRKGDLLVVARLDRLARDLMTQELLLKDIRRRGADVISCAEGEQGWLADDPDDPSRKMIRQVLGAVAEYDRAMISLRLRMARARLRHNGGYAGGEPPFGWRHAENGGLEKDQREQAVLTAIRDMRMSGHTFAEIAAILSGDPTGAYAPRRGSGRWTKQGVHRVLRKRAGQRLEIPLSA
jgi:DNA invertase Pin-like site-specific DNA recombinase